MSHTPNFLANRRADVRLTTPWSPFAYVNLRLRQLIRGLVEGAALPACPRILDYGCADAPYRDELPADADYVGADLPGNPQATAILRSDGTVPADDASFDLVLSTQVLEHVEDPAVYLAECYRVLKPGGSLVLSTHGIMYYHADPTDHWRWTWTGLEKVVTAAGMDVSEMRGVLGLAAASLQLLQDGSYYYLPRVIKPVYALVMQAAIALVDRFYSEKSRLQNGLVLGVRAVRTS